MTTLQAMSCHACCEYMRSLRRLCEAGRRLIHHDSPLLQRCNDQATSSQFADERAIGSTVKILIAAAEILLLPIMPEFWFVWLPKPSETLSARPGFAPS
jgi:hypothetical protein